MHTEKNSGVSHKGFFDQEHKRNLFFGNFPWMLIFKNNSNANLLNVFYK
jgi:hypothetical protein